MSGFQDFVEKTLGTIADRLQISESDAAESPGVSFDVTGFRDMGVRLDDYCGLWAIEPAYFNQLVTHVQKLGLASHVKGNIAQGHKTATLSGEGFERSGSAGAIAEIRISGTMTKGGSSLDAGASTVAARRAVRQAMNDDSIAGILLRIDSPGGTVAGTKDLGDDVANAAKSKPVYALIEDLGASAAYWVASQATKVFAANATTLIGSIGTYMGLYDFSKNAEMEGIRPVVIKAGEFKAAGFPGTEITDAQVAEWQKIVDKQQAQFTAAVAKGRGKESADAQEWVTGLVYVAADAKRMGLIDGIESYDAVLRQLQPQNPKSRKASNSMEDEMSDAKTEAKAASFKEIVAACPGIDRTKAEDAKFIADMQAFEVTSADAAQEWVKELKTRSDNSAKALADKEAANAAALAAKDKEIADLKAAAEKGKATGGVPAVGTRTPATVEAAGDANTEWKAEVQKLVSTGMTRSQACTKLNRLRPELRQALLAEANRN